MNYCITRKIILNIVVVAYDKVRLVSGKYAIFTFKSINPPEIEQRFTLLKFYNVLCLQLILHKYKIVLDSLQV